MSFIEIKELSIGYENQAILENINISLEKGKIISIIGPNGAGKSTFLKTISKQIPIIEGKVLIDSWDIEAKTYKDLAKKMAVLFTSRTNTEFLTCWDVVAAGRYPYTSSMGIIDEKNSQIINETIRNCDIEELSDKDFSKISDGQKQRVLLARAVCQKPKLLILDEPTAFLDIKYKIDFYKIIKDLAKTGVTILMTLHEVDLAAKLSDYIVCIDDKNIVKCGKPDEILDRQLIKKLYGIEEEDFEILFGGLKIEEA